MTRLAAPVPTATTMGFKDWALICAALGHGRQSIILRKGGIAEGRDGFRFKQEEFFLFPTQFHQQAEMVRPEELALLRPEGASPDGTVEIRYFFALDFAVWVDDWTTVARLEPFHVWREEVVRARFAYDEQAGVQCAFGRVFRLETPWTFPTRPAYGGCRSWVNLPASPAEMRFEPVLTDEEHAQRSDAVRAILNIP